MLFFFGVYHSELPVFDKTLLSTQPGEVVWVGNYQYFDKSLLLTLPTEVVRVRENTYALFIPWKPVTEYCWEDAPVLKWRLLYLGTSYFDGTGL